jgi:MYXO-CTERM domain-containing protein
VYKVDISGATDVTGIDLDSGTPFTPVSKTTPELFSLAANTLPELGNKVPEKWEGLTFGPRLADNSYLILAGTDNDYSVTQNTAGTQFDVYFRFSDDDPYASSIQCPLGQVTGCFYTASGDAAVLTGEYSLLPGVLHAYRAAAEEFANYVAPYAVPEPATWAFPVLGLAGAALLQRRKQRAA